MFIIVCLICLSCLIYKYYVFKLLNQSYMYLIKLFVLAKVSFLTTTVSVFLSAISVTFLGYESPILLYFHHYHHFTNFLLNFSLIS